MSTSAEFTAQLLETSASAYAGLAASLLLEQKPELADRYSPTALRVWRSHLQQRILELSASLDVEEPTLFSSRIRWEGVAFRARNLKEDDLRSSLICLRDLLREQMPESSGKLAGEYLETAIKALDEPAAQEQGLDASVPAERLSLQYLEAALKGDGRRAIDILVDAAQGGVSVHACYKILLRVQREVGRMWHLGDLEVAEEHVVTATTERAASVLAQLAPLEPVNGKTVITAAVAGNRHGLAVRTLSDFFEIAGWRSICLGPDVPAVDIAKAVIYFEADLLALSVALPTQLKMARQSIVEARALPERKIQIMVGGGAFAHTPELWKRLGADGSIQELEAAVSLGTRLVRGGLSALEL